MLHELGALVVEDQQVLVDLDEIDDPADHKPGDVEPALAYLHDVGIFAAHCRQIAHLAVTQVPT